jgi:hypothetical protein
VPQQFHLDFAVDDLDEAEALLLKLGAAKPDFQPGGDQWRILTDRAGDHRGDRHRVHARPRARG